MFLVVSFPKPVMTANLNHGNKVNDFVYQNNDDLFHKEVFENIIYKVIILFRACMCSARKFCWYYKLPIYHGPIQFDMIHNMSKPAITHWSDFELTNRVPYLRYDACFRSSLAKNEGNICKVHCSRSPGIEVIQTVVLWIWDCFQDGWHVASYRWHHRRGVFYYLELQSQISETIVDWI